MGKQRWVWLWARLEAKSWWSRCRLAILFFAGIATLASCRNRNFLGSQDDFPANQIQGTAAWRMETRFILGTQFPQESDGTSQDTEDRAPLLEAGAPLTIGCQLYENGNLAQSDVVVQVSPALSSDEMEILPGGARLRPQKVGSYQAVCATAEGLIVDTSPLQIDVEPAAISKLFAKVSLQEAVAGDAIDVGCDGEDRFGNAIAPVRDARIEADGDALVDEGLAPKFRVVGTTMGDVGIRCAVTATGDAAEIYSAKSQVRILPGPPFQSDTFPLAPTVEAGEPMGVGCAVADIYGNALPDVAGEVVVQPGFAYEDAKSSLGLDVGQDYFKADAAGAYFVFCRVPGRFAGDERPAKVDVVAAKPHRWFLDASAEGCHRKNDVLPVIPLVFDRFGNRVLDPEVELLASDPDALFYDGEGGYGFSKEGVFDVTVGLLGPRDPDHLIEDVAMVVRVDSTSPTLEFMDLPRGAQQILPGFESSQTPTAELEITATATDGGSGIAWISVDGSPQIEGNFAASQTYTTNKDVAWGTNILSAAATDGCGNRSVRVQSMLASGAFAPVALEPDPEALVSGVMEVVFGQELLDDGDRDDADDLATVVDRFFTGFDWNALLPANMVLVDNPLTRRCGSAFSSAGNWLEIVPSYAIQRANAPVSLIGPRVDALEMIPSGMRLSMSFGAIDVPLVLENVETHTCGLGILISTPWGSYAIDVEADGIDVNGQAQISMDEDGEAQVLLPDLDVDIDGFDLDINCSSAIQWLCNIAASAAVSFGRDAIVSAVEDAVRAEVPGLLADFLNEFRLQTGFEIPEPLGIDLGVDSGLSRLSFQGANTTTGEMAFGALALDAQIFPQELDDSVSEMRQGAIVSPRRGNSEGVSPLRLPADQSQSFAVSLQDDLLNQILWSLWASGGLKFDDLQDTLGDLLAGEDTAGLDLTGITLDLEAKTPPVLMPGAEDGALVLGLGDIRVAAEVDLWRLLQEAGLPLPNGDGGVSAPLAIEMHLSALFDTEVALGPDGRSVRLVVAADPAVGVDAQVASDARYGAAIGQLMAALVAQLVPSLVNGALGTLALPSLDIAPLLDLPEPVVWALQNGVIERPLGASEIRLRGRLGLD